MKRETPEEKWKRLARLARMAPPGEDTEDHDALHPGLATQVAARWADSPEGKKGGLDLWERIGWYGAAIAVVACALIVAYAPEYPEETSEPEAFDTLLFAPQLPPETDGGGRLF